MHTAPQNKISYQRKKVTFARVVLNIAQLRKVVHSSQSMKMAYYYTGLSLNELDHI